MGTTDDVGLHGKWVRSRAVTDSDTNSTVAIFDVPANTFIPAQTAHFVVITAFAGGTPSIDIGDGDDPNGWVASNAITEGTPATYADVDAAYNVTGKYYASADTIDAVVSASLSAGCGYAMIYMLDMTDEPMSAA